MVQTLAVGLTGLSACHDAWPILLLQTISLNQFFVIQMTFHFQSEGSLSIEVDRLTADLGLENCGNARSCNHQQVISKQEIAHLSDREEVALRLTQVFDTRTYVIFCICIRIPNRNRSNMERSAPRSHAGVNLQGQGHVHFIQSRMQAHTQAPSHSFQHTSQSTLVFSVPLTNTLTLI